MTTKKTKANANQGDTGAGNDLGVRQAEDRDYCCESSSTGIACYKSGNTVGTFNGERTRVNPSALPSKTLTVNNPQNFLKLYIKTGDIFNKSRLVAGSSPLVCPSRFSSVGNGFIYLNDRLPARAENFQRASSAESSINAATAECAALGGLHGAARSFVFWLQIL